MLHRLKKFVPKPLLQAYHFALAKLAEAVYRHPSEKLIVIGVTGTNGKSSTVNFIAQILTELGETVGYTSTAGFSIAGKEIENKMKMTMPGRFYLQKILAEMVKERCVYAVIETSSQGLDQFRHLGINYDVAVFTNLTPEHIEAHGGFDNYKKAKGKLFEHLTARPHKKFEGHEVPKTIVVNGDDEHSAYFASFPADKHVSFSFAEKVIRVGDIVHPVDQLPLRAEFEQKNALAAIATVESLGFPLKKVLDAARTLKPLAGRFEKIECGQPFAVVVDYAYEPYALQALFEAVGESSRIIGVHGSAGGGRDIARRPLIGKLSAEHEAIVIVTNEDPYDEDPRSIIEAVAEGARQAGKIENSNLFLVDDRREAIRKALSLARAGDAVLITGKGSEPVMAVAGGQKIAWDDRQVVREILGEMGYHT
ncbi:MAG: UDP-N-acetylmuramoyl-L-alanyl-D-glutamate--2,6-diaminopimelate ligase [Patescibacteria group bacterium]|jgi:UDP-N-acetylmuramoyl-L-alanyl-D-glutamate--2,6-diaminopimelate ligase